MAGSVRLSLSLALLAVLCVGPPTRSEDYDPEWDLWPIFYYNKDQATGDTEWEALFPVFASKSADKVREFFVRPFYYSKERQDYTLVEKDFIWPFGSSTKDAIHHESSFFPFYFFTEKSKGEADSVRETIVFPFYFRRKVSDEGKDFGLFPFYGAFENRFGRKKLQFVLWPIYTYQEIGDRRVWNVLWPIFSYSKGETGGGGWKIWPLYGRSKKEGLYEKTFVLWPFYNYQWARLAEGKEYKSLLIFPIYASEDSPSGTARGWLWPFFSHTVDKKAKTDKWNFPWPIVARMTGPDHTMHRVLPIYRYERTKDSKSLAAPWPILWVNEENAEHRVSEEKRLVPLFWEQHTLQPKRGEAKDSIQLWPFFKWQTREDGHEKMTVLSVYPLPDSERFDRNFGPFFTVYEWEQSPDGSWSRRVLSRLIRCDVDAQGNFFEIKPLVTSAARGPENRTFSLLRGLFEYKKEDGKRFVRLFYLPRFALPGATEEPKQARASAPVKSQE